MSRGQSNVHSVSALAWTKYEGWTSHGWQTYQCKIRIRPFTAFAPSLDLMKGHLNIWIHRLISYFYSPWQHPGHSSSLHKHRKKSIHRHSTLGWPRTRRTTSGIPCSFEATSRMSAFYSLSCPSLLLLILPRHMISPVSRRGWPDRSL